MFAKTYKLKSNNTLKNSEKKHLAQRIKDEFPAATEEKVKELVSVKSNCSCMKLIVHSGETIGVYVVDGVPVMLELAEGLVPTVCALWKVPNMIPSLIIHSQVLTKVQGGAPLYLPGVTIPTQGIGFPAFTRGSLLYARTSDNTAAALVGRAALSSGDMLLRSGGVCLDMLHYFGDLLCKEAKFSKLERPQLGPASYDNALEDTDSLAMDVQQLTLRQPLREEWPSLGKPEPAPAPAPAPAPPPPPALNEPRLIQDSPTHRDNTETEEVSVDETLDLDSSKTDEDLIPEDMDGLLRWCLLSFLKLEGKSVQLPLKTNLLYKAHLFPLCPPDRTLDVKKSTYKKMGKFLEAMQQEGLIEVRELEKGVDAVMAVNTSHPAVRKHAPPVQGAVPPVTNVSGEEYIPPQVKEVFCVTANVVDLFAPLRKGTALTAPEIRAALTEYVKSRSLQSTQQKSAVTLDPLLAKITGKQEQDHMKWEELMTAVQSKMTAATEMRFADGSVRLTKSKLELIRMQVASRSGNKKVTLVSNLEAFGFNLVELGRACQVGVAASCGVTRSPGAKADQLMLQGDQTYFIAKLLIEKYGIPKKYVEGADKALKKKK